MRRAAPTPALVEQDDAVRPWIEVPSRIHGAAGPGATMKDQRGLPDRIAAHLPVDAMPVPNIEHASIMGFDGWE